MKKIFAVMLAIVLFTSLSAHDFAYGNMNTQAFEYESENPETAGMVWGIASPYYHQSGELAGNSEIGRAFTDHKEKHVKMVAEKSLETGEAIKSAVEGGYSGNASGESRISFGSDIDKMTLEGAALSHDTGMSGSGYALKPVTDKNGKQLKDENGKKMFEKNVDGSYAVHPESNSDFNEVRENHSLNSALNVLKNREQYREAGYSDEQIDKIAAECMAHSKSGSGLYDLNSREDWADCFDRIDSAVEMFNRDHPDAQITFVRSNLESDPDALGVLASETLALRIGDVSRDSSADAESQSGEIVHVDRSSLNNHAGSIAGELENANITIGEHMDQIMFETSRQVHAGEQNIVENHTNAGGSRMLAHVITVADGSSAPKCTQEAIGDHLGEFASARDGEFDVIIRFITPCDEFAKNSYEKFRDDSAAQYPNVDICYSWDEE